MALTLSQLRHIASLARTGSFSRAAADCHVTQPALSRSIAAFETRHGVALFERTRSGVIPTPAGRLVVERALTLLDSARDLEEALGSHESGETGEVRIGVGPLMASMILPSLGKRILSARPKMKLLSTIKARSELMADLLESRLELVLASPEEPGIILDFEVSLSIQLPLSVLVRGGHPLALCSELRTADLSRWPAATHVLQTPASANEVGLFACENHHVLRDIVLSTDCYTCTSAAFVMQELSNGQLIVLDVPDFPIREVNVAIMRRRNRPLSPAALAVEKEAVRLLVELRDGN